MHSVKELEPWIETFTGKKVFFLDPTYDMIDIKDIAHSLSMQCRFNGHIKLFYSVAEHCMRVSQWLHKTTSAKVALQGLLHDAAEAYIVDVPSPVKQCLKDYYAIEERLLSTILNKYHAGYPLNASVKEADSVMLKNEALHLLPSKGKSWAHLYQTAAEYNAAPFCLMPREAETVYMNWFNYLYQEVLDEVSCCAA